MNWTLVFEKLVLPTMITVGAYVWSRINRKKEEKTESRSLLDDIVENFIYELLDRYPLGVDVETYLKNSRGYIEEQIWKVAKKRGIPKNKTTESLFHAALERGTKILTHEITELRKMNEQRKHEIELQKK